jgi:uncharacterized iron-regulated membrane protein
MISGDDGPDHADAQKGRQGKSDLRFKAERGNASYECRTPIRRRRDFLRMTNRKLHRWLGLGAGLLFLVVAVTGVLLQVDQLLDGDDDEESAMLRSPISLAQPFAVDAAAFERARTGVAVKYADRGVAAVDWRIKGNRQSFVFHLDGSDPLKVEAAADDGTILSEKPDGEGWLIKLHTGEILGDGGKVLGLFWGVALVVMLVTGFQVYLQLLKSRRKGVAAAVTGWRRYFW